MLDQVLGPIICSQLCTDLFYDWFHVMALYFEWFLPTIKKEKIYLLMEV